MSKYSFIQFGKKVKYDPLNNGNFIVAQVCTPTPEVIYDDTVINLIPTETDECEEITEIEPARAYELKPYLEEFNKGYWCAIQDASSNGASDTTIKAMLQSAGFSYDECIWHIEDSEFESDRLLEIVGHSFQKTFARVSESIGYEPQYLTLELSDGTKIRGIEIEERVDNNKDTLGYHIYDIRHSDDTLDLSTIEKHVCVNWECSIAVEKPIEAIENGEYLEIVDWSYEDWHEAAINILEDLYEDNQGVLEEIHDFVIENWKNMDFISKNIDNFKKYMVELGLLKV